MGVNEDKKLTELHGGTGLEGGTYPEAAVPAGMLHGSKLILDRDEDSIVEGAPVFFQHIVEGETFPSHTVTIPFDDWCDMGHPRQVEVVIVPVQDAA